MAEHEVTVPLSAASKNLRISLWFLVLGLVLVMCHVPWWVCTAIFAISGGFLISMIMCVFDVQEFTMKQNQEIIRLLTKEQGKYSNKKNKRG
jgi:hypothetical protein